MEGLVGSRFWDNKRVLITGHTGFKGTWLSCYLEELGAQIAGFSLQPETNPSMYEQIDTTYIDSTIADIRSYSALQQKITDCQPEIIFHMAAQPIVIDGYLKPRETFDINMMGTVNLLEAARDCPAVRAIVVVTTDKCYQNLAENRRSFQENDRLGGQDPYSSSKACCELITESYYHSFFKKNRIGIGTARAGNVIGGGDWAAYRLIPDLIRGVENNQSVSIRYPNSVRPWQHVLDALTGYLILAQALYEAPEYYSGAWNFGPSSDVIARVEDLIYLMKERIQEIDVTFDINTSLAESAFLSLDSSKAQSQLGWRPRWNLQQTLEKVCEWYSAYLNGQSLNKMTTQQINEHRTSGE